MGDDRSRFQGAVGDVKLTVNGQPIHGNLVPYAKPGEVVNVECEA